jgi:HSP20 family protein
MSRLLNLIPKKEDFIPTDLFDDFFSGFQRLSVPDEKNPWLPAFDISENNKEYTVTAELPGMDIKDIDVTLSNGILSVKGAKKQEHEFKGEDCHRIERRYGSFNRSFSIPAKIKTECVDANYKDGLLRLILPKTEESETKKIEVK